MTKLSRCPKCGGEPSIRSWLDGNAYFVQCGSCGEWDNGVRHLEATPTAALSHWPQSVKVPAPIVSLGEGD
jgi:Zn ribbon nucleic-acid-binding protein